MIGRAAAITALVFILAPALLASTIFGPPGIGVPYPAGGVRGYALGGAHISLMDSTYIPIENPAGFRSYGITRFSVAMNATKSIAEDGPNSDTADDLYFPHAAVAVPIYRTLGFGLAYRAISDHQFLTFSQDQFEPEEPFDTLDVYDVSRRTQGLGGLSRASASVGFNPKSWLTVGVSGDYYFGDLETLYTLDFVQGASSRSGQFIARKFSGFGLRLGAIARPTPEWSLAAALTLPSTMRVETSMVVEGGDSTGFGGLDYELPLKVSLGASRQIGRLLATGQLDYEFWESTERDFGKSENYVDAFAVRGGVERLASGGLLDPWYEKIIYRLGGHWDRHYVEFAGNPLFTYGVSAGIGVPMTSHLGVLNLAFTLDFRGNASDNGGRETVYGFSLGIASSERWFQRRRR